MNVILNKLNSYTLFLNKVVKPVAPILNKIEHTWLFFKEIFIKDFFAVAKCAKYNSMYLIKSDWHGLNPKQVTLTDNVAKVILLIPGGNGKPFTFYPLAKKLKEADIPNVFTVKFEQTEEHLIPTTELAEKIDFIARQCLQQGAEDIDFFAVGHCLGGVIAHKRTWAEDHRRNFSKIIAIASRILYKKNSFSWYCQSIKPELKRNFPRWEDDPQRAEIITIRGDQDGLVPKESAHFQKNEDKEYTVRGAGHLGIMYSDEALNIVVDEIRQWET